MDLTNEDLKHYMAASAWINCEADLRPLSAKSSRFHFRQARKELSKLSPAARREPLPLTISVSIHRGLGNWGTLASTAAELARLFPGQPNNFVDWAYGVRRSVSLAAARDILLQGERLHPDDAKIQFYLAGHEAQLGNIDKGAVHLGRAMMSGERIIQILLKIDVDIVPLLQPATA